MAWQRCADFLAIRGPRCGRRLGEDADRYGSGDVALDVEDVRRALGYPRINYFGPSYGAVDAQAYGVRFPTRVRSVVADAGVPVGDPRHSYLWNLGVGPAIERSVQLACRRAPFVPRLLSPTPHRLSLDSSAMCARHRWSAPNATSTASAVTSA